MNQENELSPHGVPIKESIPLRGVARLTSQFMMKSHQEYASITGMLELDFTLLEQFRQEFPSTLLSSGTHLSMTPLMIKILALSLEKHPRLNSTMIDNHIKIFGEINIGMAVAMDNGQLVVPVIRNVDRLTLPQITAQAGKLAGKVREGKIDLEDVGGGTFTFSNFGMFGGDIATPLINPPQSAILAMGRIIPKPVVVDGEIAIRKMGWISVTVDHRSINGVQAAQFGKTIEEIISNPHLYLKA